MANNMTQAETMALLHQKANEPGEKGGNNFWVKVYRRRVTGAMPDSVATFSGAQLQHFQHPEMWLPRILGGGPVFLLSAYHDSDPTLPIGDFIQVNVAVDGNPPKNPSDIDFSIIKSAGWLGPRQLEWPTVEDRKQAQVQAGYSVPSLAVPPSGNSAANNVPGGGAPSGMNWQLQQQMQAQQVQIDRLTQALELERERATAAQRESEETRRRAELDGIKRDADARQRESDAKLEKALARMEAMQQTQPAKAAPSVMEQLPALIAAVAPILEGMRKSSDDLRATLAAQQSAQQAQTQTMLTAMMGRPSVDPAVEKNFDRMMQVLEKSRADTTPPHEMLHNMAEAMSTMTSMTLDLAEAAANVGGGGQRGESPALSAIKQGVKAVTSLMEGYQQSVNAKMGVPQHLQHQPQQVPAYVQQAQQPVPQYAPPQQQPQPVQQPAQVVQFPPKQQAAPPPPSQQVVTPNGQPVPQAPPGQYKDVVEYLEAVIKAFSPPADVAKLFIDSINDPAMEKALQEAGDDPNELVAQRLGGWVMATPGASNYLGLVLKELNKQGLAAGIFEDENLDDDDPSDDDQDGDAAEAD